MKNKNSRVYVTHYTRTSLFTNLIAPNVEAELYELLAEEAVQNRARVLQWILGKEEVYYDDA